MCVFFFECFLLDSLEKMLNVLERERFLVMFLENRGVGVVVWELMICVFIVVFVFLGNIVLCLFFYKMKGF